MNLSADYLQITVVDSSPLRVCWPLQARPELEIAIFRRTDRSVSALGRRFLELLAEQLAAG